VQLPSHCNCCIEMEISVASFMPLLGLGGMNRCNSEARFVLSLGENLVRVLTRGLFALNFLNGSFICLLQLNW
jgi:hypothetical protein